MMRRIVALLAVVLLAPLAHATPANQSVLDGWALEYDATDLRSTYEVGMNGEVFPWGEANVFTNLMVTWDETYLYITVGGYIATDNVPNKIAILMDVDPGNNTGPNTTTNWLSGPGYIVYNDVAWTAASAGPAFGLDYMIASEGTYNNILRVLYDSGDPDSNNVVAVFDNGNGSSPVNKPVDMVARIKREQPTTAVLNAMESRIPWAELYSTNRFGTVQAGEVVPRGAALRLLANMHNNVPSAPFSSPMVIPTQNTNALAVWTNGYFISDTYVNVAVDANNDGFPDVLAGDANAPWLRTLAGAAGQLIAFAGFNKDVDAVTATNPANWQVEGTTVAGAVMLSPKLVQLNLGAGLPAPVTYVKVTATGVTDTNSNTKTTFNFLQTASGGVTSAVTVRFVLETASGLGSSPGASNFFINGSVMPLEWGYPPSKLNKLSQLAGSLYYRDVIFLPGTPSNIFYKYSGELSTGGGRGTNNYEAVRLMGYADASRSLYLNGDGTPMVVTDYLGAAAGPWRDAGNPTNYNDLYYDVRRGDAGVRERSEVLFQVDLSKRDLRGVQRVLLLGSDPLRGFNENGQTPRISDYATALGMDWLTAGVTMYDDGTHGDQVAGDSIYSRIWYFTPDGYDNTAEPDYPYALVGGNDYTQPYLGESQWENRRSPRGFEFKYAVARSATDGLLSPSGGNLGYYLGQSETSAVMSAYLWDNGDLPPPPPSNSPTMQGFTIVNNEATVLFSNDPSEQQHGAEVAVNLASGDTAWQDYGIRAATNLQGFWQAKLMEANANVLNYRAFAGPAQPYRGIWCEPNPLPATGGGVRVYYYQHARQLAGYANLQLAGDFNGWTPTPMIFMGNGAWYCDAFVSESIRTNVQFKARNLSGSIWEGWTSGPDQNFIIYKGEGRATWAPNMPTNGGELTITYNPEGGPLAAATAINAWLGYDDAWFDSANHAMTSNAGLWTVTVPVPTNRDTSLNFVFNNGSGVWDSEGNWATSGGRINRAFIKH